MKGNTISETTRFTWGVMIALLLASLYVARVEWNQANLKDDQVEIKADLKVTKEAWAQKLETMSQDVTRIKAILEERARRGGP